ncbi:MAG: lysophospholipid acyltransferase family protein [Gammaproteobacteria bacterium]|nr:lysophospholipid acyltransferase family protein [Gammaproteobacteria bacterium]
MLSVESLVLEKYPGFLGQSPDFFRISLLKLLKRLFHEKTVNEFLEINQEAKGLEFVERVLEYFQLSYSVSNTSRENIPATGKVIIFANHPLGALDALCLVKMVSEVRKDVKIVANELLSRLEPLESLLLPVDVLGGLSSRRQLQDVQKALEEEQAVIFFPSGEVSRARPTGVRDTNWNDGFLRFAIRVSAPLLPVHVNARNSALFYSISALNKPAAGLLLVNEMFWQRTRNLPVTVGEMIPANVIVRDTRPRHVLVKQLRRHLYRIGKNKSGLFPVEKSIAHPESRAQLRKEIKSSRLLGCTTDNMSIHLLSYHPDSAVMREIGRLREISFRRVGEGSGQRRDNDEYDRKYEHIVLWDDNELEIVGSYRVARCAAITSELYVQSLFVLGESFADYRKKGLELGRSFVQPRYWGSRALDYLWQGIGAYLRHHPEITYLFGPVSISNAYPKGAINLLVYYYNHYYGVEESPVAARQPFALSRQEQVLIGRHFLGNDHKADFKQLKVLLRHYNVSVPTLYKQYPEVFDKTGIQFLAWNIDDEFSSCVDGFLLADLAKLKASKRKRYIDKGSEVSPGALVGEAPPSSSFAEGNDNVISAQELHPRAHRSKETSSPSALIGDPVTQQQG